MGNAHLKTPPTEGQILALQVIRIVVSVPSILGATYIVQHVLRSPKRRRRPLTRVLLGMSANDLLLACVSALSSSIAPAEFRPSIQLASGTWRTCEAFAFLQHGATISSVLYNGSLTLQYLLSIRYGWSERKMRRLEPWLHAMPLLIGWGTAIPGLPLEIYNPIFIGCDIVPLPMGCDTNPAVPCQRGRHAHQYRTAFYFCWIWATFCFVFVAMLLIYRKIAQTDRESPSSPASSLEAASPERHQAASPQPMLLRRESVQKLFRGPTAERQTSLNRLKRQFATQALLYCSAFFLTWVFFTVELVLRQCTDAPGYMPIIFLSVILYPLQGFWNFFIYVRPRYLRYRKRQREEQERQRRQKQREQQKGAASRTVVDATLTGGFNGGPRQAFVQALKVAAEDDDDDEEEEEEKSVAAAPEPESGM